MGISSNTERRRATGHDYEQLWSDLRGHVRDWSRPPGSAISPRVLGEFMDLQESKAGTENDLAEARDRANMLQEQLDREHEDQKG